MRNHVSSHLFLAKTIPHRQSSATRGRTHVPRKVTRLPKAQLIRTLVAAGAAGLIGHNAYAASATWNGTTDGAWNSATNWSNAGSPGTALGETATFANAGNGKTTLTIDSSRTVKSITFNMTSSTLASYTIGAAGANAGPTLNLEATGTIQITSGTGATGRTETFNAPLSLGGSYTVTNAQTTLTGSSLVFAGDISNSAASQLLISGAGTGSNFISGDISDGVGLQGVRFSHTAGRWEISGDNSYSGGTTVSSGAGTVSIGSNTAFGTGSVLVSSGTIEAVNGPRTLTNSFIDFGGATIQGSQDLTFNGQLRVGASNTRTLNVTNSGATTFANLGLSYAGASAALNVTGTGAVTISFLSNGGGTGTGNSGGSSSNLIYAGSSTLTLSGANVHTGITTFNSGTIAVSSLANGGKSGFTITTTSGGMTASVSSAAGLFVGQTILTAGQTGGNSSLQAGTTITSIETLSGVATIGLSQPATTVVAAGATAFAGTGNGLGISTNAATNLVFNSGTLKYTGSAVQTDRLFTIGGGSGTIDSSGSGLLEFTNTGTIGTATATHSGTLNGTTAVTFAGLVNTADLFVGMTVTGTGLSAGTTISSIGGISGLTLSQVAGTVTPTAQTLSFTGGPTRTLTLTGTSAGSLASILANPVDTSLGVSKTGAGSWSLRAANTYSGGTAVSNGALLVDNITGSGTGTGSVAITGTGTRLGGSGTIAPGSNNGVTVGSGSLISPGGDSTGNTLATLKLDGVNTTGQLLKMNSGAKFAMGLDATAGTVSTPGQSDVLMVLNAQLDDVAFNNTVIDLSTTALTSGGYYKLFDTDLATGTWSGLTLDGQVITGGLTLGAVPINVVTAELIVGTGAVGDAGDIYLSVAVPEPMGLTSSLLAGGLFALHRRRRCK